MEKHLNSRFDPFSRLVYHDRNLLAEIDASSGNLVRSYAWGLDLSGSLQGAGGVGGLLAIRDHAGNAIYYPVYDGNGNVTGLIDTVDSSIAAIYEYGPFGEEIRATGPAAELNPFRFSTKYFDAETELLYYGYRFYSPSMGRWLNRDPINEPGHMLSRGANRANKMEELNLYAMVRNDPVNGWDYLGLESQKAFFMELLQDGILVTLDLIDDLQNIEARAKSNISRDFGILQRTISDAEATGAIHRGIRRSTVDALGSLSRPGDSGRLPRGAIASGGLDIINLIVWIREHPHLLLDVYESSYQFLDRKTVPNCQKVCESIGNYIRAVPSPLFDIYSYFFTTRCFIACCKFDSN